jgi:hypothetical protein
MRNLIKLLGPLAMAVSMFYLILGCRQSDSNKTKRDNQLYYDSLKSAMVLTYFDSINESLSSDSALLKEYQQHLIEGALEYLAQNQEMIQENIYTITEIHSSGDTSTTKITVPANANEPYVGLNLMDVYSSIRKLDNSINPSMQEGAYYQVSTAPVVYMPASYYNKLSVKAYRNTNANREQSIIHALSGSFQGLGNEGDVLNTLNNSFNTSSTDHVDAILNWQLDNIRVLNELKDRRSPTVNTFGPVSVSSIPYPGTTNPYRESPLGTIPSAGNTPREETSTTETVTTVIISSDGASPIFYAGAGSSYLVEHERNVFNGSCAEFIQYLMANGIYDGEKYKKEWAGATRVVKWNPQLEYVKTIKQKKTKLGQVYYVDYIITGEQGKFQNISPEYYVYLFKWNPSHTDCYPHRDSIYSISLKHENHHVDDIYRVVQEFKQTQSTVIKDIRVGGTTLENAEREFKNMLTNMEMIIGRQMMEKFKKYSDDFDLTNKIKKCNCDPDPEER